MDEFLSQRLSDWSDSNWTSRNRNNAGRSRFTGSEKDYADFTYIDSEGDLTRLLLGNGLSIARDWLESLEQAPKYHLEVKATSGRCDETFYMSNNQVKMVCQIPSIALHKTK